VLGREPDAHGLRPIAMLRHPVRRGVGLLGAVVVASGVLAACSPNHQGGAESGACAAVIVHDGQLYLGTGGMKRDPATTGRLVDGVVPGCDDSGGQLPTDPDQHVKVEELADVPVSTAVLWQDVVYVRRGAELPVQARTWFRAPKCASSNGFELTADWIGVTSPRRARFDGDLRPPYRLEVHVVNGPRAYVGATIHVRADAATRPGLSPRDVRSSLVHGGQVVARVDCVDGQFHATSLQVPGQR